jgi:protein TonB
LSTYRLELPYERASLQRRATGLALALAINLGLLLVLMTLGIIPPPSQRNLRGTVIDLMPMSDSRAPSKSDRQQVEKHVQLNRPIPKPPPVVLPVKPTIAPPPTQPTPKSQSWIEMTSADMAASDIGKMAKSGSGSAGDSEIVGRGPNGEAMYAAQWAREPTDAELAGYLPRTAPEGYGLVACKTIAGNRVEDCVELESQPPGSRLASAVRQAAWQFRVRPPRKGGKPLIGSWVRIRIEYSRSGA